MNSKFNENWKKLEQLAKHKYLRDLSLMFASDSNRVDSLSYQTGTLSLDLSKNWIDGSILDQLIALAKAANLDKKITALFAGEKINTTENKAATHTQQRHSNPVKSILNDRQKMFKIAKQYSSGQWVTAFGKTVKVVVNIGIGGSYLGPKLAIQALTEIQTNNTIKVLFYPSVDDSALREILQNIDIRSTLFCLSSKSLGTIETIKNTETILNILNKQAGYLPNGNNRSLVAATANFDKAAHYKIPASHVMPFDNATGGRFSVWSSIGFPLLMAIGEEKFLQFLGGAELMDNHFRETSFNKNVPVIMALVSIWYRNFIKLSAYAVIPYDVRLKFLPSWLQQLMMESNGKIQDINGKCLQHETSPILFGDHGQLSQHAFFQAFHQGSDILPIDFIGVLDKKDEQQKFLLINMLSQSSALMNGSKDGGKNCYCPGNRPSTVILLKELSPSSLGQLLAMYEHMIFVQSVIWNINCFDQPGVELGKNIAKTIGEHMQNNTLAEMNLDASTQQLLDKVLNP